MSNRAQLTMVLTHAVACWPDIRRQQSLFSSCLKIKTVRHSSCLLKKKIRTKFSLNAHFCMIIMAIPRYGINLRINCKY